MSDPPNTPIPTTTVPSITGSFTIPAVSTTPPVPTIDPGNFPDMTGSKSNYNLYTETVDPGYKIKQLLLTEKTRLEKKKDVINPIYYTKQRQDAQKRSMTLRQNAFTYIFLVVVILVGICISLVLLRTYFPIVPENIVDGLLTIVIGGGLIFVGLLFADIINRDVLDFEKIDYGVLIDVADTPARINPALSAWPDLSPTECVGEGCCTGTSFFYKNICNKCPEGLVWNAESGACVLAEKFSSFSPNPSFTPL